MFQDEQKSKKTNIKKLLRRNFLKAYTVLLSALHIIPKKKILIIGHMRSGSSLVTHILIDNTEIAGIGETHTTYNNKNYKTALATSLMLRMGKKSFSKKITYLLDKVLHDYIKTEKILTDENTKIILLARCPEQTIPSIIKIYKHRIVTKAEATAYYSNALKRMLYIKRKYDKKCFLIDYENFLEDNENILQGLSNFLNLKTPLSSSYEVNAFSGKAGIGDFSKNLLTGRVLNKHEKQAKVFDPVGVEKEFSEAVALYAELKQICGLKMPSFNINLKK